MTLCWTPNAPTNNTLTSTAWPIGEGKTVGVPLGYAQFPREILTPPRSLAAKLYPDIRRWTPMPKGGHFAALEQPEALAAEILAFFAGLG